MPLSHWFNRISICFAISLSVLIAPVVLHASVHHAGATIGSFSVSSGTANYNIPIEIPPGMAGMEPTVSLSYSSGGSNGLVGVGWSIGGLSQINRCSTNLAKDGFIDGVDFDSNDRFCLDGQRLVAVTGDYCDDGCSTVYRTEHDSFYKIVSFGSTTDPSYFKVRTSSGQIKFYGASASSRIEAQGRQDAHVWAINRVEDSVGNYLTYKYYEDNYNGYSRIDRIDYTGNVQGGLTPSASVVFEFDPRQDIITGYEAGSISNVSERLSNIKTFVGNIYSSQTLVRDFKLIYKPVNNNSSQLGGISECDANNICKISSKFQWQINDGFKVSYASNLSNSMSDTYFSGNGKDMGSRLADINGDGLTDMIQLFLPTNGWYGNKPQRRVYLNNGSRLLYNSTYSSSLSDTYFSGDGKDMGTRLADIDGDGLTDIIQLFLPNNGWYGNNPQRRVYLNKNNRFNYSSTYSNSLSDTYFSGNGKDMGTRLADIDGDGLTDIIQLFLPTNGWYGNKPQRRVYLNKNSRFNYNSTYSSSLSDTYFSGDGKDMGTRLADINGDGLTDIIQLFLPSNGWYGNNPQRRVFLNNGNKFIFDSTYSSSMSDTYFSGNGKDMGTRLSDINGDGLTDVIQMFLPTNGWYGNKPQRRIYLNNGKRFVFNSTYSSSLSDTYFSGDGKDMGTRLADVNGDGVTDIIQLFLPSNGWYGNNPQRRVYLNKNNKFFYDHTYSISLSDTYFSGNGKDMGARLADIDGNGVVDVVQSFLPSNGWYGNRPQRRVYRGSIENGYNIVGITTLESTININYKVLTDKSIYIKQNTANNTAGYIDIQSPMQVVSSYSKSDGIGGRYSYSYQYEGLKSHRFGYGSMGFAKVTMIDNETGLKSIVNNHQTYPLNGKPSSDKTMLGNVMLTNTTNNWQVSKAHGGKVTVIQLRSNSSTAREINTNQVVKRTTTTNTYDAYNNVTRIVLDTHDGYQKITNNTYQAADIYQWFTGRLANASVTNVTPTGNAAPRTSRFEYNYNNGLLTKEIIEPNSPNLYKETTYTYDVFGNKATITVNGHSAAKHPLATRVTRSRYIPSSIGSLNPKVETTNHLGHTETKTYDARFGKVVALTGPNGLTTTWAFDTLGRQIKERRADGTYTTRSYDICESNCDYNAPLSITTQDFGNNRTPAGPPATIYFDGQGREKVSTTIGIDGRLICKESHYDHFGRVAKASQPYYAYISGKCNLGSAAHQYTVMQYDVLGRVTKTIAPDRSYIRSEYRGLQTTTINDYEQRTVQLKNSQDQLIKVTDDAGNSTTYDFDPYGNMVKVRDAAGNITRLVYNLAGQKIEMIDPDMGHWYYEHNALGELVKQTDAKRQVVTMQYDTLGRMVVKNTPDGSSYWTYDPPGALGKIDSVRMNGLGGFQRSVDYDRFIRPISTTTRYGGVSYTLNTQYDRVYSRVTRTTYPGITSFGVDNIYTANGYLKEIRDSNSNLRYWQLNRINARGQTVQETYGNGVSHYRSYDGLTGRISNLSTGKGSTNIQALSYEFDTLGNLVQRRDNVKGLIEDSDYDNLSRLTATTVSGSIPTFQQSYVYDSIGNIKYKSDVGSYLYGQNGNGPHQVTRAGWTTYNYDQNGNQISGDGRTLTYTSFNKPKTVKKGGTQNTYAYDADQNRIRKISDTSRGTSTTFYLGKAYEKTRKPSGVTEHTYYVGAGSATIKITKRSNGRHDTRYMHTDHIGSIDAITNEYGQVVEQNSFSAWGQRRYSNWQQPINQLISSLTTRGFTGHEMEDEIGLINMNARLYDAKLGRFLQADTIIQFPESTQGFNRYTYVNNNPLSFTDPTGHSLIGDIVGAIVDVVTFPIRLAVKVHQKLWAETKRFFLKNKWAQQLGSIAAAYFGGPWGAALFQGYMTHIQGGSWSDVGKSMAISFISAQAFSAIGDGLQAGTISSGEAIFAHGMVGGATAELQGGSFKDGFVGAAVGKMVTLGSSAAGIKTGPGQFIMATLSGGISAELGGGKFADGAQSAAMGYIFNAAAHATQKAIAANAKSKLGSTDWNYDVEKGNFGKNTNKCNLFVYDTLVGAGADVPLVNGGGPFGVFGREYPPLASQWADPGFAIEGWKVVSSPQAGDVAAMQIDYSDATGHVAIVSGPGTAIGTSSIDNFISESNWGFRKGQKPTFRRYVGK